LGTLFGLWLDWRRQLNAVRKFGACGNEDAVRRAVRLIELNAAAMRGGSIELNSVPVWHCAYSDAFCSFADGWEPHSILSGPKTLT
jgi:hypothetical protein